MGECAWHHDIFLVHLSLDDKVVSKMLMMMMTMCCRILARKGSGETDPEWPCCDLVVGDDSDDNNDVLQCIG